MTTLLRVLACRGTLKVVDYMRNHECSEILANLFKHIGVRSDISKSSNEDTLIEHSLGVRYMSYSSHYVSTSHHCKRN